VLGRQVAVSRAGAGIRRAGANIEGRRWVVTVVSGKPRSRRGPQAWSGDNDDVL
jgi:hypothetical protein